MAAQAASKLVKDAGAVALGDTYALFPELAERKGQNAGTLSGGQQQLLALGHALVSRPKYILIDEMSLGLAPLVVKRLMGVVGDLKPQGVGVILIEQFTELALGIADNAMVLRGGKVRFAGSATTLKADTTLLDEAHFGRGHQPTAAGGNITMKPTRDKRFATEHFSSDRWNDFPWRDDDIVVATGITCGSPDEGQPDRAARLYQWHNG